MLSVSQSHASLAGLINLINNSVFISLNVYFFYHLSILINALFHSIYLQKFILLDVRLLRDFSSDYKNEERILNSIEKEKRLLNYALSCKFNFFSNIINYYFTKY